MSDEPKSSKPLQEILDVIAKRIGDDARLVDYITYSIVVGQGISIWTQMEASLIQVASILLGAKTEKMGIVLYSIPNFHSWLNITDDLFQNDSRFTASHPKWNKISGSLRSLNDTRVRLAHHTTYTSEGEIVMLRAGRYDKRQKVKKYSPLSPADILKFINDVIQITEKMLDLSDELLQAIENGTSPNK